jgi:hypothetical protein
VRTLRACLLDEPLPRVIALGDLWDAPVSATTPRDVVESLTAHMLVERHALDAKAALPEDARVALEAVIAAGGKMPLAGFERRFGSIRPMGPGKLERERPWLAPASSAETLWYHGFIFRAFDKTPRAPVEMAFVPNDLRALITPAEPQVTFDDGRQTQGDKETASVVHRLSSLLDDVTTILCHIQNGDVKARASDDWDAASHKALLPMLRNANEERLALLLHLIDRLGWMRASEGRLRLIPQPVTQWLQSRHDAQREVLFNAWLDDAEWNDLAHVPGLSLQMTHAWSNNPVRERRAIVGMWEKRLENRDWRLNDAQSPISNLQSHLASFIAHVKTTNPDFARTDGRYDTWHVRDEASGEFLHGFAHWDAVEGALIRYLIAQPMAWLSFDAPAHTPSPEKPFTLTSDGRVTIAGVLRLERFQLARVADWQETAGEHFTYLLTARSLARAREQGIRAQRVLEFLEQSSGMPAPAALAKSITRWSERGVEARMEPLVILKTQDGAMMEALLKINEIRRAVVDRFAPNCISIRVRDAEAVRSAIVNAGVMADLL